MEKKQKDEPMQRV